MTHPLPIREEQEAPSRRRPAEFYVTDEELLQMIGPEKQAREFLHMMDKNPKSGFPKKNQLFGNRRYLPAVRDYFDRMNGRKVEPSVTYLREPRNDR